MNFKKIMGYVRTAVGFVINPCIERLKSGTVRRRSRYARYYKYCKVDDHLILYEAFFGRGMLCNPYALFKELLGNPRYKGMRHIWVLDSIKDNVRLIEGYKDVHNVSFVEYQSRSYLKLLCKAKYLVNNTTFPSYFVKKENQVYVNTWHGIPLKHLGYDMPNGKVDTANVVRNFMHADYILSANSFLTEIYLKSYKLETLYPGKIIEEGYPRLDTLVKTNKQDILQKLRRHQISVDANKKLILYAPTWRGSSYGNPTIDIEEYVHFKQYLDEHIDNKKYQVLIKVHQVVYQKIKTKLSMDYIIPATIDANEILSIADILISDYSSIYFDFLETGRPVLFYITDEEAYKKYRGLYFTLDSLPGPHTNSLEKLTYWINNIGDVQKQYGSIYGKIRDWCGNHCNGNISKRVIDIVFATSPVQYKIISNANAAGKKLLISRGPALVNGITSSWLNLLQRIDNSGFDISAGVAFPINLEQQNQINKISDHVRTFTRIGAQSLTLLEDIRNRFCSYFGLRNAICTFICPLKAYQREYRRCYGEAEFDCIIDFEGFNLFYSLVHLQGKGAKHCIWQHSDMLSECETRMAWLKKIFKLYPYYDRIVSCSHETMIVNRLKLATEVTRDKYTYAKNFIDTERVLSGAAGCNLVLCEEVLCCVADIKEESGNLIAHLIPLEPDRSLPDGNAIRPLDDPARIKNVTRFITVGRLSVEKNHAALIQAFAQLSNDTDHVMLYIVGNGPHKKEIAKLIRELNLEDQIVLTGNLSNPFALMKHCDCFILPSLHEGQPMVLHEARILHMPIIISNFSSAGGSIMENGQLVIDTGVDDIYEGMKAFLEGKVPVDYVFNPEVYNQEAYEEFLNAVL